MQKIFLVKLTDMETARHENQQLQAMIKAQNEKIAKLTEINKTLDEIEEGEEKKVEEISNSFDDDDEGGWDDVLENL